ncbi:MAG: hypothetical protein HZB68_03340 [Candidatus Aenigmarchaeota archaeon]|nr:hypothetical protein [Candidatus Aenigmarchaeota archaeon]
MAYFEKELGEESVIDYFMSVKEISSMFSGNPKVSPKRKKSTLRIEGLSGNERLRKYSAELLFGETEPEEICDFLSKFKSVQKAEIIGYGKDKKLSLLQNFGDCTIEYTLEKKTLKGTVKGDAKGVKEILKIGKESGLIGKYVL